MYWGTVKLNNQIINTFAAHNVPQLELIAKGIAERDFQKSHILENNFKWRLISKGLKTLKCVADDDTIELYVLEYEK